MLTGNRDIDMTILNKLEDVDLVNACQTNKVADEICNDQTFWMNRVLSRFNVPIEILREYKGNRSWSEYYIYDLRLITPNSLIESSLIGRLDQVMIAVSLGADIHTYDKALIRASLRGHLPVVQYLAERELMFTLKMMRR